MTDLPTQIRILEAAVDRVRRLHGQYSALGLAPGVWCPGCGWEMPCPTIAALDGPSEEKRT